MSTPPSTETLDLTSETLADNLEIYYKQNSTKTIKSLWVEVYGFWIAIRTIRVTTFPPDINVESILADGDFHSRVAATLSAIPTYIPGLAAQERINTWDRFKLITNYGVLGMLSERMKEETNRLEMLQILLSSDRGSEVGKIIHLLYGDPGLVDASDSFPDLLGENGPDPAAYVLDTTFSATSVIHRTSEDTEEQWTEVKPIGQGAHGTVSLERSDGTPPKLRAVKRIPQVFITANGLDVKREILVLVAVREEELFVQFHGWYEDPTKQYIYLAMEYAQYSDLGEYLKDNALEAKSQVISITRQLVKSLSILHGKGISHCDLKPKNILIANLSPITIKLADFGLSRSKFPTNHRTHFGTPNYMAPELLGITSHHHTRSADLWALGCLIHQLLTGETPFRDRVTDNETETGIGTAPHGSFPVDMRLLMEFCSGGVGLPVGVLEEAGACLEGVEFVRRMLVVDPGLRMTAEDAMQHAWIMTADVGLSEELSPVPEDAPESALASGGGDTSSRDNGAGGGPVEVVPRGGGLQRRLSLLRQPWRELKRRT